MRSWIGRTSKASTACQNPFRMLRLRSEFKSYIYNMHMHMFMFMFMFMHMHMHM